MGTTFSCRPISAPPPTSCAVFWSFDPLLHSDLWNPTILHFPATPHVLLNTLASDQPRSVLWPNNRVTSRQRPCPCLAAALEVVTPLRQNNRIILPRFKALFCSGATPAWLACFVTQPFDSTNLLTACYRTHLRYRILHRCLDLPTWFSQPSCSALTPHLALKPNLLLCHVLKWHHAWPRHYSAVLGSTTTLWRSVFLILIYKRRIKGDTWHE